MCQIRFTIGYTDIDGDNLQAAEGRYKLKSESTFQPTFHINLLNPITPDITVEGVYDLEVRIQDTRGLWSSWFASPDGFKIGNCIVNAGEASVSPMPLMSSGHCSREVGFPINGAPNEVVNYELIFTPEEGRNITNALVTLDDSGRGKVTARLGSLESAQSSGTDSVRLNVLNTKSTNNTSVASMNFTNCPV